MSAPPPTTSNQQQQPWRRNKQTQIQKRYKSSVRNNGSIGRIGQHWIPPLNANIEQPVHLARSLGWSQIAVHTLAPLPYGDGFRWDRPADIYKRFGGQCPFNYVPDAMDQGACGSCWAFSVALVHTSRYRIWTQTNVPLLSPSPILSCVSTSSSDGCNGGQPSEAAQYCLSTGLPPMECADYGWCAYKSNYCSDNPMSGAGFGQCLCKDEDRPTCAAYKSAFTNGQCMSCVCSTDPTSSSCSKPTCADKSPPSTTSAPTLYGYSGTSASDVVLFDFAPDSTKTSSNPDAVDYSDLQLRIMMELFQHGPVQANYFVMADFYTSTISADNNESTAPQLWWATDGVYMNAPGLPDLYSSLDKGSIGDCQMCPSSSKGCAQSNTPASVCLVGAHAVAIVGFGARKISSSTIKSVKGPMELISAISKQFPDAASKDVCYYWVCQNSWGSDWNSNQPTLNSDGLSNGKWFHAMSGTYQITMVSDGSTKTVPVNTAIGLDHTVKTLFGSKLSTSPGSVFGGVLSWSPGDYMARWPFGRGPLSAYIDTNKDKLANSDKLVPCLEYKLTSPSSKDPSASECRMIPAKYCTTEAPSEFTTCADYLAHPQPTPNPQPAPTPTPPPSGTSTDDLSTRQWPAWAIVLLSVGSAVLLCVILFLVYIFASSGGSGGSYRVFVGPSDAGRISDTDRTRGAKSSEQTHNSDYGINQRQPVYSPTQIVVQGSVLPPELKTLFAQQNPGQAEPNKPEPKKPSTPTSPKKSSTPSSRKQKPKSLPIQEKRQKIVTDTLDKIKD